MPEEEYLRPEDIRPEHAREVLDFLNSAETAEQIAAAVEIPGELDVGVRIAQRILDRRGQLGGFTDLHQLATVPLVGSERFTEIVTTLSGAQVPMVPQAPSAELLREIRALREQVKSLQAAIGDQPQVVVRALQEQPFLGQAVNLVVTVIEAGGKKPRVGAPLTLITTWGRLRAADGLISREGSAVTVRTDGNGKARALLVPPVSEDLLRVQQDTLEVALRLLDPDAITPREVESSLREIARQYRLDGNPQLRRAIDIYFQDFGKGLLETLNVRDYMLAWSYFDSTVLAYARDDTGSHATSVDATAALSIRFKNWLAPWLEKMESVARQSESQLAEDLSRAREEEETGALLGRVYVGVRDFVSAQRGLVGEYVGQRIAQTSLRNFLQSGIAGLTQEKQLAIFPALDAASHTVISSDASVLSAVGETRVELRQELDTKIDGVETRSVEMLDTRVGALQSQLDAKVNAIELNDLRTELNERIDRIPVGDVRVLSARVDELQTQLDEKVDNITFREALNDKADVREVASLRTELARKVNSSTFTDRLGSLQGEVSRLEDRIFPP